MFCDTLWKCKDDDILKTVSAYSPANIVKEAGKEKEKIPD